MSFIGVDVGTGGCKAILLGENKKILGSIAKDYDLHTPKPGWVELDPGQVFNAVKFVIGGLAQIVTNDPIRAISVSSMGDTITPCDINGEPVGNSILAFDTRNIDEANQFEEKFGKEWIFKCTGQPIHPTYSLTKILWIQRHLPDLYKTAKKYLCYEDFITCQLCGEAVISYSSAGRVMAFDINKFAWDDNLLAMAGINEEHLAKPVPSGQLIGEVKNKLAQELGLPKYVQVISGGHDQPCGSLGSGFFRNDFAIDSTGTVEVLLVSQKKPLLTEKMLEANICFWPHVIEDQFCVCGQVLTAGASLRWFRDTFFEINESDKNLKPSYDLITSRFPEEPTSLLFIPHLAGCGTPEFLPAARGVLFGATLQTNKYQIAKSIIEGICFEMRLNIDLLERAGIAIKGMRSIGGATKSEKWMQMKADIFGMKIEACQFVNQCPLGAAFLAAYGVGFFNNINEAADYISHEVKDFEPDEKSHSEYQKKSDDYMKFRSMIFNLYEQAF